MEAGTFVEAVGVALSTDELALSPTELTAETV
jgi:hypothetical protein